MSLVPKKGLEPPHPCEYMDLNHARLPIPPLRLGNVHTAWSSLVEEHANRGWTGCLHIVAAAGIFCQCAENQVETQGAALLPVEVHRLACGYVRHLHECGS